MEESLSREHIQLESGLQELQEGLPVSSHQGYLACPLNEASAPSPHWAATRGWGWGVAAHCVTLSFPTLQLSYPL